MQQQINNAFVVYYGVQIAIMYVEKNFNDVGEPSACA